MSHACAMRLLRSFGGLLGCSLLDMIYISPSIWVWSICSPILLSISVSLFGACVVTTSPKLQQKNNSRLKREKCALTWLPSFCQKTAGCGFPFVSHGKLAVRPCATIWSRGLITNCGAAESRTKDMNITPYPQTHKCTWHTHTLIIGSQWETSSIHRHWLPRSLRQSFHASARFWQHSASWFICLLWPQTERTATATTGSHSSRWARRWPYWMNDGELSGTAVLRSQHQREGWVIPVRTHGEEKLCEDTTPWTWTLLL